MPDTEKLIQILEESRAAEKRQALRYRALAAAAEEQDLELAPRFHDLHADEQHHLSRLTARILELGGRPVDLGGVRQPPATLEGWQEEVKQWEAEEVSRYAELVERGFDDETDALIREILAVEEKHAEELGGKWTLA